MSNPTLIQPNDPMYFTQTSNESYDRHFYRVVLTDGRSVMLEDYEQVRSVWFEYASKLLSHVEVIDACQYDKESNSSKGFK